MLCSCVGQLEDVAMQVRLLGQKLEAPRVSRNGSKGRGNRLSPSPVMSQLRILVSSMGKKICHLFGQSKQLLLQHCCSEDKTCPHPTHGADRTHGEGQWPPQTETHCTQDSQCYAISLPSSPVVTMPFFFSGEGGSI